MNVEPKTAEELLSCEERPMFETIEIVIEQEDVDNGYITYVDERDKVHKIRISGCVGDVVNIPRVTRMPVTPVSPDSLFMAVDHNGLTWRPVKYGDEWYKQRVYI